MRCQPVCVQQLAPIKCNFQLISTIAFCLAKQVATKSERRAAVCKCLLSRSTARKLFASRKDSIWRRTCWGIFEKSNSLHETISINADTVTSTAYISRPPLAAEGTINGACVGAAGGGATNAALTGPAPTGDVIGGIFGSPTGLIVMFGVMSSCKASATAICACC